MEEKDPKKKYLSPNEYVEEFKEKRRQMRAIIMKLMEEETGETYKIDDDLNAILKALPSEQQQNIYGKLFLAQQMSTEEDKEA